MGATCSKIDPSALEGHMRRAEQGNMKLELVNAHLTPEAGQVIGGFLEASTLLQLNLAQNELGDEGCIAIARPMADNTHLHRLVLSDNFMGDAAVKALVDALIENRHLRNLDVHNNEITARGAQDLGRLLRYTHHLESLLLGSNQIGDKGVRLICNGCKLNHRSKIHKLGLSSNGITDAGLRKIWRLVEKYSHTITSVELGFNMDITDHQLLNLVKVDCNKNKEFSVIKSWKHDAKKHNRSGTVDQLTSDQKAEFKQSFKMFDRDNDGTVARDELKLVLNEIGHPVDEETLINMMNDADADGSGIIDEGEFLAMMARQMVGSESESESDTDAEENTSDDDLELSPTGPSMAETLNATGNKLEAAPDDEDFDNPLHVPSTSFV
jgi:Ran GTPase-activating protein (RanGAP) involved in mRNA processing and transport